MNQQEPTEEPIEDDDAKMKKILEGAMQEAGVEDDDSTDDPFATDALGHTPAIEDDSGRV